MLSEEERAEVAARLAEQRKKVPERDGVALTTELIRRKAEHNEGMLHNLEEIALHQLDIDKIESLNHCKCLKIVYLQANLIRKIEGLNRLKELDYLNIAMNNITRIENLERNEALVKLDMTCNFVDLDELHTVGSLKNNTLLDDLYLTGNPCITHWDAVEPGRYRDYVIATLPQLSRLDGTEITRTERIKAMQRLPELAKQLKQLAPIATEKRRQQRLRWEERTRKIASGELVITNETTDEWCPEVRVEDARELRKIEEEKTEYRKKAQTDTLFGDQAPRERRFFKEDGTPIQMNTAKWPFSIEEDAMNVYIDVALPKFLDSAAVDADVQPLYVRVVQKIAISEGKRDNTLQLVLPAEVSCDASNAKRSATTGHLLLTCPKLHPVTTSKGPAKKKTVPKAISAPPTHGGLLEAPKDLPAGSGLKGSVDLASIVADGPGAKAAKARSKEAEEALKPTLGPDFDDEDDVPDLM